jgi:hypothetical protein
VEIGPNNGADLPITTTLGAQRETFSSTDKGAQSIVSPIAGVVCISFDEKQWDSDRDHAIPTDVPSTLPATDETPNSKTISPIKRREDEKSTSTAIPIIDWGRICYRSVSRMGHRCPLLSLYSISQYNFFMRRGLCKN